MIESKHLKIDTKKGIYRVCLMGAPFDTNNRGVSALSSSLVKLVKEIIPEARISYFVGGKERGAKNLALAGNEVQVDVINYRLSPRSRMQENLLFLLLLSFLGYVIPSNGLRKKIINSNVRLCELNDCDLIGNIHGGDSFSDIYGLNRFIIGNLENVVVILLGKKPTLFPQTYGPYNSWLAKAIARWLIWKSEKAYSRDRDSITLIRDQLGIRSDDKQITFCPDVAFTLPSIRPTQPEIFPPTNAFGKEPFLGINVNGLMFQGGYTGRNMFGLRFEYKAFILKLIETLMAETSSNVAFIPHTYGEQGNVNSDPEAAKRIYETLQGKYKNRLYVVTGEYDQFEIKGVIGQCEFFIGSRMHACIAAISQNVPTAAIAYSKKFNGVFESVGLGHMVVDARLLDMEESINRVIALYRDREAEKLSMADKTGSAKQIVYETFERLLKPPRPDDRVQ